MARLSNHQNWRAGLGGAESTRPERSSCKYNDLHATDTYDGCRTRAHAHETSYV